MKAIGQTQAFLINCDLHVCADHDPDLLLDRVLVGTLKRLMRRSNFIHLKNNSSCQRWRFKSGINSGFMAKLLVKKFIRFPPLSMTTTRRSVAG